jgi:hypothetical protein
MVQVRKAVEGLFYADPHQGLKVDPDAEGCRSKEPALEVQSAQDGRHQVITLILWQTRIPDEGVGDPAATIQENHDLQGARAPIQPRSCQFGL